MSDEIMKKESCIFLPFLRRHNDIARFWIQHCLYLYLLAATEPPCCQATAGWQRDLASATWFLVNSCFLEAVKTKLNTWLYAGNVHFPGKTSHYNVEHCMYVFVTLVSKANCIAFEGIISLCITCTVKIVLLCFLFITTFFLLSYQLS